MYFNTCLCDPESTLLVSPPLTPTHTTIHINPTINPHTRVWDPQWDILLTPPQTALAQPQTSRGYVAERKPSILGRSHREFFRDGKLDMEMVVQRSNSSQRVGVLFTFLPSYSRRMVLPSHTFIPNLSHIVMTNFVTTYLQCDDVTVWCGSSLLLSPAG